MFKQKDNNIYAIANASVISIEKMNDEMFAKKLLGNGIAFILKDGLVKSPVDGELTLMFPTGHAFGLTMHNGVQILVHIGLDTVKSNGKGFKILKKQSDFVKKGEAIVEVDLAMLSKSYDMTTALVITETNGLKIDFKDESDVTSKDVVAVVVA